VADGAGTGADESGFAIMFPRSAQAPPRKGGADQRFGGLMIFRSFGDR